MGKSVEKNVTGNVNLLLCTNGDFADNYSGTVMFAITSGSCTWKLGMSLDEGVTIVPLLDPLTGVDFSKTVSNAANFDLGKGDATKVVGLYLMVTNATSLVAKAYMFGN